MTDTIGWILLAWAGLIILLWTVGMAAALRIRRDRRMRIQPLPDALPSEHDASVTILISAHNEARTITSCLDQLLDQNYANLRVTVVNDRSVDETSGRVREVMARDRRVDLIEIDHLPCGWIGKTHALSVAAPSVQTDYLLFMDSDCRLEPGALAAVMKKAVTEDLDFISLWPWFELRSLWEKLLSPSAYWLLGLWAVLNAGRGERNSNMRVGCGAFMLLKRKAYEQVGGHASVPAELAEDAVIARRAAELGMKRWTGFGAGLYASGRSNGFAGTINSWTRIFVGSLAAPWKMVASLFFLPGGYFVPFCLVPLGLYLGLGYGLTAGWVVAGVSCAQYLWMLISLRFLFDDFFETGPFLAYFPLGTLICTLVILRSCLIITGRGTVRWGANRYIIKGTRIAPEAT